jgi:excisionase family DNA binding protein
MTDQGPPQHGISHAEREPLFGEIATLRQQRDELMRQLIDCQRENRELRQRLGEELMTTWLTVPMAVEYSTVGLDTIREAVKRGDLKAYAIGKGREYRLTAADIDEWLMSRSYEPRTT